MVQFVGMIVVEDGYNLVQILKKHLKYGFL